MAKISAVEIPTLLFEEGASPSNPAAGFQRLFVASADSELTLRDSGGSEVKFAPQVGTTKGDLYVYNGTSLVRLPVGSDDQVLTADSAEAAGVKWAAASGGGGSSFSGARVSLTANESTTSATPLFIPWDQADFDTDSFWSAGNPTRLTIPTTGYYLISGALIFDGTGVSSGIRQAFLREDGTTLLAPFTSFSYTGAVDAGPTISYIANFTASQYVEVRAYQDSGSSVNLESNATHVEIAFLGS